MKAVRVLGRNIKNAFKSVFRNLSLSVASIVCTTITLILVSIAVILSVNARNFTKDLESEVTMVVFLQRGTTIEEELKIREEISNTNNVNKEDIVYKNKEEVKKEMMKESSSLETIMSTWTEETNPLQSEFIVPVNDITKIKDTVEEIKKIEKVDKVQYGEEMVAELVKVFDVIETSSVVIIGSLIIVTIFLICNTIKLTIFSRKSEIDIMRLVGTSNTVIKLPFVIEGLILGIVGSIIPIVSTIYLYMIAYDRMDGYFLMNIIRMVKPFPFVIYSSAFILIIGAVVGMIGSYRSVRKYLKI